MMKLKILVAFAAAAALVSVPVSAGANEANNPTYESVAWPTQSTKATAFILRSSGGLLNALPDITTTCANGQVKLNSIATVLVSPVALLQVGKRTCDLRGNLFDDARATIADLSILGGLIRVRGIDSHCSANQFTDTATVGSVEATVITSGNYTRNGSGGIVLPDGTTVYFNLKYLSSTKAGTVAVTIHVPAKLFSPARTILIGGCELSRSVL